MKPYFLLITLAVFTIGSGIAADSDAFQFRRGIETEISAEGLGTIELDREFFSRTRDEFPDLRLFRENEDAEVEVPFIVERVPDVRPGSSAVKIPSDVISFDHLENGDVEFRVRLRKGKAIAGMLELKTPLRNFEKSVSVSAVDESGVAKKIVNEKLIFDYDSFLDFRRTTILLPQNESREFLVRVSKATDKQRSTVRQLTRTISPVSGTTVQKSESIETRRFRIDELSVYTAKVPSEKTHSIRAEPFEIIEVKEDEEKKQTQVHVKGDRVPFDSLVFETADRNFKRRVGVQVLLDGENDLWRTVHTGTIHRYDIGEVKDEKLTLSFSEQRCDRIRLLVHHRDSPPIKIEEVVGVGEKYELRFIAEPGASYAMRFGGSESIDRPDYDIAAINAADSGKIERLSLELGALEENPDFKLQTVKSRGLNQPWILWTSITVAVSGLVLVLLKTAKAIDENTE